MIDKVMLVVCVVVALCAGSITYNLGEAQGREDELQEQIILMEGRRHDQLIDVMYRVVDTLHNTNSLLQDLNLSATKLNYRTDLLVQVEVLDKHTRNHRW